MNYPMQIQKIVSSMEAELDEDEDLAHNSAFVPVITILRTAERLVRNNILVPDDVVKLFCDLLDQRHYTPYANNDENWAGLELGADMIDRFFIDWTVDRLAKSDSSANQVLAEIVGRCRGSGVRRGLKWPIPRDQPVLELS